MGRWLDRLREERGGATKETARAVGAERHWLTAMLAAVTEVGLTWHTYRAIRNGKVIYDGETMGGRDAEGQDATGPTT